MSSSRIASLLAAALFTAAPLSSALAQSKDAEPASRAVNDAFLKTLPFSNRTDFEDARRGFIATASFPARLTSRRSIQSSMTS